MSANGDGPRPLGLAARIDPARVRQLEQQTQLHSTLLVARALSDVSNFTNALHFLTEQANMGNSTARQTLKLWFDNLDAARAAAVGIVTARETPPAGP